MLYALKVADRKVSFAASFRVVSSVEKNRGGLFEFATRSAERQNFYLNEASGHLRGQHVSAFASIRYDTMRSGAIR